MPAGLGAQPWRNVLGDEDAQAEPQTTASAEQKDGEDDEDDYMNFVLPDDDAGSKPKETSLQRAARLKREAEARSRPKSKAEMSREEELRREQALLTQIDQSNRGWKMMAKQGFRPGDVLGPKSSHGSGRDAPGDAGQPDAPRGLREPLAVDTKQGREGIGMLNEKKRKFRDEVAAHMASEKRQREDVDDYRVRQAQEREEQRAAGQLMGAQKIAINFEEDDPDQARPAQIQDTRNRRSINVLWRGYVKEQREREHHKQLRHDLNTSLSRRPGYAPEDDDEDDATEGPTGEQPTLLQVQEDEDGDDDQELADFEALPAAERLARVTALLRLHWHYCFWCKARYADDDELQTGCPGPGEEDHE